jgi:hypothetical protein
MPCIKKGKKMSISNSIFKVITDHGQIVYSLQPQHLNQIEGTTLREKCICYGEQLAVKNQNQWYKSGMKEKITDMKLIELLEQTINA